MSSDTAVKPSQIRAARHLANLSQDNIANATGLSLPTIRRAESERDVSVSADAIAAIRASLEAAGVEFIAQNGGGAGVRLRKSAPDAATLDRRIAEQEAAIAAIPEHAEPSPEAALATMDKALAENDLIAMKNKRTRRKSAKLK